VPLGTNEGNYLVEIDGVTAVRAMKVSGGGLKHTPTIISEGNKARPSVVRGNYEVDELSIQQASALNDTGRELFDWLRDFATGDAVERRGIRLVTLSEDGQTPVEVWDYIDCVPTGFQPDDRTARGTNAASFTFTVKPSDKRRAL
jgi:phage tail-like protein